jgi:hypothetical protein
MCDETDYEFLERLAMNDYMIDTEYLPDGIRLREIAKNLEYYYKVINEYNLNKE